jgi:hypothetical protein
MLRSSINLHSLLDIHRFLVFPRQEDLEQSMALLQLRDDQPFVDAKALDQGNPHQDQQLLTRSIHDNGRQGLGPEFVREIGIVVPRVGNASGE